MFDDDYIDFDDRHHDDYYEEDDGYRICANCEEGFTEYDVIQCLDDELHYCESCAEDVLRFCEGSDCNGYRIPSLDAYIDNKDEYVCSKECAEDIGVDICRGCNVVELSGDLCLRLKDGMYFCFDCSEENGFKKCKYCKQIIDASENIAEGYSCIVCFDCQEEFIGEVDDNLYDHPSYYSCKNCNVGVEKGTVYCSEACEKSHNCLDTCDFCNEEHSKLVIKVAEKLENKKYCSNACISKHIKCISKRCGNEITGYTTVIKLDDGTYIHANYKCIENAGMIKCDNCKKIKLKKDAIQIQVYNYYTYVCNKDCHMHLYKTRSKNCLNCGEYVILPPKDKIFESKKKELENIICSEKCRLGYRDKLFYMQMVKSVQTLNERNPKLKLKMEQQLVFLAKEVFPQYVVKGKILILKLPFTSDTDIYLTPAEVYFKQKDDSKSLYYPDYKGQKLFKGVVCGFSYLNNSTLDNLKYNIQRDLSKYGFLLDLYDGRKNIKKYIVEFKKNQSKNRK